jgi:hypothetical protein
MFDTGRMSDELKALKIDVTRLLSTASEEMFDSSNDRAEALSDQIKAALAELGETVRPRALQAQVDGSVHHPLSTIVPMLVPLIAIIIKNMRKAAKEPAAET